MVFYDLGANIGLFSLLAARIVGARGRVFSFEPDAKVAGRLRRNIAQNEASNITVIEAGIWSTNGKVHFVADESSPERVTGRVLTGENQTVGMPIRSIALDDFIQSAPPPDAIKCDVEGAELEALRGAERLFQTRRPWIICEMHSETNDRTVRDFLGRLGYDIQSLDVNHVLGLPRPHTTTARAGAPRV
jgi:FkbM family methyltransferase